MYKLRIILGDEEVELSGTAYSLLIDEWASRSAPPPVDTSALMRRPDPPWPALIDPALDPGTLEFRYSNRVVGRIINIKTD
jgi:hypothetical protein